MQTLHLLLGWKGIMEFYKRGEIGPAGGAGSIFYFIFFETFFAIPPSNV